VSVTAFGLPDSASISTMPFLDAKDLRRIFHDNPLKVVPRLADRKERGSAS